MTPLTTRGGGGGVVDRDFFGFLTRHCPNQPIDTIKMARRFGAPSAHWVPRSHVRFGPFQFNRPMAPASGSTSSPIPLLVQPFHPSALMLRGWRKILSSIPMAPLLQNLILSRRTVRKSRILQGHEVIESDNFVFPRTGVQVAARYACHWQQAGRWSDRRARALPIFTLSYLVCESPMSKACGLPFKHTRISHGNALFDGLFGLGVSEILPPRNRIGPRCCFWPMGVHKMLWLPALWIRRIPLQGALNSEANPR